MIPRSLQKSLSAKPPLSRRTPSRRLALLSFFTALLFTLYVIRNVWYSKSIFIKVHMLSVPDITPPHRSDVSTLYVSQALPTAYSAAIVYLASLDRARELILSLSYLSSNIPSMPPWPIVLFHAGSFDDSLTQDEFKSQLYLYLGPGVSAWGFVSRIEFVKLHWTVPDGIPEDRDMLRPVYANRWPGYHHMCSFYASHIFQHPRLQSVTYYMRMDTDSYIYEPLCYDPIAAMHIHNRTYGFRSVNVDQPFLVKGLWTLVDTYAREHKDIDDNLAHNGWKWPMQRNATAMEGNVFPLYYNNFEIVKLDAFRRPDVKRWLDELSRDPDRFYKWRWGDAPLRYATVNMFFDIAHDVEQFCAMHYHHQSIQHPLCECKPL